MTIKDWPDDERPREKLLQRGPEALTDAELVAILLRVGVKGRSAVDLARDLLAEHGSLRGLLGADLGRFAASKGMGEAKYVQFQAALEIGRRYLRETLDRANVVESPESAHHYLKMRLVGYPHEVFACLFLDNRHRVIEYEELFRGTIDGASVHPREVVRRALAHNAAAVILAHNHPSGVAEPSDADRHITRRLKDALALVDVRVLDHIIVGDGADVTSLANRGWI